MLDGIGDNIARITRCPEDHCQLSAGHFENACGHSYGVGGHVVIDRWEGFATAAKAVTRELADVHFGFRIEGDSQAFRVFCGTLVSGVDMLEEGVCLGNLV